MSLDKAACLCLRLLISESRASLSELARLNSSSEMSSFDLPPSGANCCAVALKRLKEFAPPRISSNISLCGAMQQPQKAQFRVEKHDTARRVIPYRRDHILSADRRV